MTANTNAPPHVVIIGGGFGGLYAARTLRRAPVRLTLVDRRNHHLFQPLLYQVATADLNPSDIAAPIRRILRKQANATVLLAEVTAIDAPSRRITLDDGESIAYDYLIVATGATHSYFGQDEWARHAPGLKTIEDALEIRRRVLYAFEAAEREDDEAARRAWLNFVVVGGGPTGVELAGAIADLARRSLVRDFRKIDPSIAHVVLVEAADRILGAFSPELSEKAKLQLEGLGVEVRLKAKVTAIDDHGVTLGPDRLAARTVLWGAGVQASPLARSLGAPLDRAGRVKVNRDLTIPDHPEVTVIGDLAAVEQDGGKPVPGVAPAAMQGGRHAARNIERAIAGRPLEPFRYVDKGSLATIGRAAAVADFGKVKLTGLLAWLAWLFIHVLFLIGFRNRFGVLMSWGYAYLMAHKGAALITGDVAPLEQRRHTEATPEAVKS